VEKTVENRAIQGELIGPMPILLVFPHGERVCGRISPRFAPVGRAELRILKPTGGRKSPAGSYFGRRAA
jgi:hypothetical protein